MIQYRTMILPLNRLYLLRGYLESWCAVSMEAGSPDSRFPRAQSGSFFASAERTDSFSWLASDQTAHSRSCRGRSESVSSGPPPDLSVASDPRKGPLRTPPPAAWDVIACLRCAACETLSAFVGFAQRPHTRPCASPSRPSRAPSRDFWVSLADCAARAAFATCRSSANA